MNVGNVSLVQQNNIKQNEHMNAPLAQQNKIKQSGCVPLFLKNIITIDKRPITKVIINEWGIGRKKMNTIPKGKKWGRKKK